MSGLLQAAKGTFVVDNVKRSRAVGKRQLPLGSDNTITMWMPLVDAAEEMGTMTFAS